MASTSTTTLPRLPLFEAISRHDPTSTAIVHSNSGRAFTYGDLLRDVADSRGKISDLAPRGRSLRGERVAFLVENGAPRRARARTVTFLSILANHALALPLAGSFPAPELRYIMNHSQASLLLASAKMWEKAQDVLKEETETDTKPRLGKVEKILRSSTGDEHVVFEDVGTAEKENGGLMLYTSGTTSRPKGVVLSSATLHAQSQSLLTAWEYSPQDRLLHVLPLHHIHGTQNALLTPLLAGSTIEFLFPFSPEAVWTRLASPFLNSSGSEDEPEPRTRKPTISFLTVVPTIYSRLLDSFSKLPSNVQPAAREAIKPTNLRLPISGSAALPAPTRTAWHDLSAGNVLLERYGMTEVGMALSCGLSHSDRIDGSVGWPLPGVCARLVDSDTGQVIEEGDEKDADGRERQGDIQLRGPTVFSAYFRNPEASAKEFTTEQAQDDGAPWFKTGDVAVRRFVEGAGMSDRASQREWARGPAYFIQGRLSSDIIKSGGEKVSALEVEREMLALEQVKEVSVVGVKSEKWGQKVSAIVVLDEGWVEGKPEDREKGDEQEAKKRWTPLDMRRALKSRLVPYKIPQEMRCVQVMPRNAMGKVNKKQLVKDVFGEDA
ncbi:MAG: hypothetical protein M1828_000280 [Chrysothrix sp. TS-e1954]|nr:MAG: hypothetical protein M1828_000280 [Chrysothrix sp. TS-e1954]